MSIAVGLLPLIIATRRRRQIKKTGESREPGGCNTHAVLERRFAQNQLMEIVNWTKYDQRLSRTGSMAWTPADSGVGGCPSLAISGSYCNLVFVI
jgi:hypothetical protein